MGMANRIYIRVDSDVKERFAKEVQKDGLDPSSMIRVWIMQYLQSKEKPVAERRNGNRA